MNAHFVKRISLLLLLPFLTLTQPLAHAQGGGSEGISLPPGYSTNANSSYDIEIANGQLLLAPLKGHADMKTIWGNGDINSVPATVANLAKYLRVENSDLNIVLSPGTAEQKISDLKLRSSDMKAICEAVTIATDSKVRGSPLTGKDNWTFVAQQRPNQQQQVEVFNLTGYIQTLNATNDDVIYQNLDELKSIIVRTLERLADKQKVDFNPGPDFQFHVGTRLLIVMGTPEAIDVTRKIVNALPGQPRPFLREDLLDISTNRNQK